MTGCSASRFLKEGETFYAGAEVVLNTSGHIQDQGKVKKVLESYISPDPSPIFLGSRPSVWLYYIAGNPKKEKGFRNFVKYKLGKKPVLLSDTRYRNTTEMLKNELHNEGFFQSDVTNEIRHRGHRSKLIYTVNLSPPFRIRNVKYNLLDSVTTHKVLETSLLEENQRYRLATLQDEQSRIEAVAQNNGYFYFDDRYLLFEADSTIGNRSVDVDLIFEPGVPAAAKRIYTVGEINIFPNYSLGNDSLSITGDTTRIKGYNYIDNLHSFRPEIIADIINLSPDSIYRQVDHEYTLSRLMSLNTFKYVNAKYEHDSGDSSSLTANIYLTPLQKKSLRLEMQVVSKSNNFVGPGIQATYSNRNFFRGAELFQLKLNASYEAQISSQQSGSLNAIEYGIEASLAVPRFIAPININYRSSRYQPQTQFKLGYTFQERLQYFRLTSSNAGYGFNWRETAYKTHELFPAELSYVRSSNTSAEFDEILSDNPSLAQSFQDQFIPGLHYTFTLNTQYREPVNKQMNVNLSRKSDFYSSSTLGLAGNLLNLVKSGEQGGEIFGLPYSQYVMAETDFRYHLQLNKHSKLATHLALGVGYAYGNATQLPYIKQFAVGGSNSIRAFPARSVGPGTYNVREDTTISTTTYFIDQRADIKIDGSIEYRFDVWKNLKGAVFIDAGNIWLMREDSLREGGKFNKDTFLKELAVGNGVGLRYDFGFFVLRFDVAFPIRKPYLPPADRWVINEIDFGSSAWRRDNLILNIAIGYPF